MKYRSLTILSFESIHFVVALEMFTAWQSKGQWSHTCNQTFNTHNALRHAVQPPLINACGTVGTGHFVVVIWSMEAIANFNILKFLHCLFVFVYVIAWGRVKLVFNFTRVFKVSQNCPSRAATRVICETLKTRVKLNTNFTRTQCDYTLIV